MVLNTVYISDAKEHLKGVYRQRLTEEESPFHASVVGQFEHYFDTVRVVRGRLRGKTLRLALLLFFQCLSLDNH